MATTPRLAATKAAPYTGVRPLRVGPALLRQVMDELVGLH